MAARGTVALAALSRLFSPGVFRELAQKGKSSLFKNLVTEIDANIWGNTTQMVSDAFNAAFNVIAVAGNRDEYVYKSALVSKILLGRHNLNTATMITELRINNNRADIVIVNGTLKAYEIKSEKDDLTRLPKQLESYQDTFACVNVIASENHVKRVMEIAPSEVGVYYLSNRNQISTVREAENNPERVKPSALFQILRVQEAIQVLTSMGLSVPEVPNTVRYRAVKDIFEKQSPVKLHRSTVEVLRKTRNLAELDEFRKNLPESLSTLTLSTRFNRGDQTRIIDAINTPFAEAMQWT